MSHDPSYDRQETDSHELARKRYGRGDMRVGNAGHSSAAWIGVAVILAGCVVAAVALPLAEPWLFWTGVGVAAVGAVLGKLLSLMGLGVPPGYHQEGDVELRDQFVQDNGEEQWSADRTTSRDRS
ncbi:HGxxPAAW family protein [Streptodolium elevatio]|uniref:HGxxPAAW family protein n=1 Tax=Streptodolium elevatio TaxID=3157996 RepID=A0ABV3DQ99_9ACTN